MPKAPPAAGLLLLVALAACGGDDGIGSTATSTAPALTETATASPDAPTGTAPPAGEPTSEPTESATSAATETLPPAETETPGGSTTAGEGELPDDPAFASFATELRTAVVNRDTKFLYNNTAFADFECTDVPGFPSQPDSCTAADPGTVLPAMFLGVFQSEGSFLSPVQYEEVLQLRLGDAGGQPDFAQHDMQPRALGQLRDDFQLEESPAEVFAIVTAINGPAGFEGAMFIGLSQVEGNWAISEIRLASAPEGDIDATLDDLFAWTVPWE